MEAIASMETASSLLHGFSARTSARVTFSRDTLEQKVAPSTKKPSQQVSRSDIRTVFGEVGKISERVASSREDPVLVSLVNYHSKLVSASGRSFDLVVGKLCHLLKTNGFMLDMKYQETMNALFFSIRSLIVDQEKSDLSRTRLLEALELRARSWDQDPVELSELTTPEPAQLTPPKTAEREMASPEHQHVPLPRYSPKLSQQDSARLFSQEDMNMAMTTPFPDSDDDDEEEDQWTTISDATYESDTSDEFVMPDMDDLMLESTIELDDELARLLASKIPTSYRRQVNDGKPVRYTMSFLLNCWRSPFAKEMPAVLRHTIAHSDIAFILRRHAFTDPKELFTPESRKDILLFKSHLTMGSESGRTAFSRRPRTPEPSVLGQGPAGQALVRERTKSWPEARGVGGGVRGEGGGGGEARNWETIRQGGLPGAYVETGGGDARGGSNLRSPGSFRTRHLSGRSTPDVDETPGSFRTRHLSGRSTPEVDDTPANLRTRHLSGRSTPEVDDTPASHRIRHPSGRSTPDVDETPGSFRTRHRSGRSTPEVDDTPATLRTRHLSGRSTPEVDDTPASRRIRYPSGKSTPEKTPVSGDGDRGVRRTIRRVSEGSKQMNEGSLKVTFSIPDEKKEETKTTTMLTSMTAKNSQKPVSPTSNVLSLGGIAKQEDTHLDMETADSQIANDSNNNGHVKDKNVPTSESSQSPVRKTGIPTFKEVFKQVIEQGLTAANKEETRTTPSPGAQDGYNLRPNSGIPPLVSAPTPYPSPIAGPVPLMQSSAAPDQKQGGWRPAHDWPSPVTGILGAAPPSRSVPGSYPGYVAPPQPAPAYAPAAGLPYGMGARLTPMEDPSASAYVSQAK